MSGDATIDNTGVMTITADAVTTTEILDGTIAAADIANNAVDATRLNVVDNGTLGQTLVSDGDGSFSWADEAWSIEGNAGTDPATDFLGTTDAQDFVLRTNNTEKMRIASGGNVGIGADTPAEKLEVNGNLLVNDGIYSKDGHLYLEAAADMRIEFKPRSATHGVLIRQYNSSNWGNIMVDGGKLELSYKQTSSGTQVGIDTDAYLYARRIAVNLSSAPTYGVQIYTSGTVSNSEKGYAGAWVTASDGRFKANKTDVLNGLDKVLLMKPIYYQWTETITDNETGKISVGELLPNSSVTIGFVAQDMINIVPEVVGKPEDETKEKWGIEYAKLTPVIVSAIQEQQKLIEKLQQDISNLKAEVSKVKALVERLEALRYE